MSIWLIFALLFRLAFNSIHARRKRVFKICKSMSAILALETDTQTEIETEFETGHKVSMRYTRTQRAFKCNLSTGSSFWRLSLLTLRRRRRRRRVSFGVWKSRQFHLSRAKNETYPTDTQYDAATTNTITSKICYYNFNFAMHNLFRESWK